jgi:hypothetical protein
VAIIENRTKAEMQGMFCSPQWLNTFRSNATDGLRQVEKITKASQMTDLLAPPAFVKILMNRRSSGIALRLAFSARVTRSSLMQPILICIVIQLVHGDLEFEIDRDKRFISVDGLSIRVICWKTSYQNVIRFTLRRTLVVCSQSI